MERKTSSLTSSLIFLLFATATTSVLAEPRLSGVHASELYLYSDIHTSYSTNDPMAVPPEWIRDMNETVWYNMSIINIVNTNISLRYVQRFKNGSEKTYDDYIDINTGETTQSFLMIIAANLQPNDAIYASGEYSTWKINETISKTYPGGSRLTNHINRTGNSYGNYYWDKQTGVFVECQEGFINQTGSYLTTWESSLRITESNVWVVPEFPSWTPIIIVVIITLTFTALTRKRKLTKKSTKTSSSFSDY